MKRGFLKTEKKETAPAGADVEPSKPDSTLTMRHGFLKTNNKVAPSPQVDAKTSKPILIPAAPNIPPDVTVDRKVNYHTPRLVIGSLQPLNIYTCFLFYPGTKEAMLEQCEPVKVFPAFTPNPFVRKEVAGQGQVSFAARDFNTGDFIWDECPILLAPQGFSNQSILPIADYMKMAIDRLSPYFKSKFYELHNCKSNDPNDVLGIVETNALGIGQLPGPFQGEHWGIFPMLSRINHSCSPNAEHHWNLKTYSFHLTASRPIAAGEQISIAYIPIFEPRAERQSDLKSQYAFTCTCTSCALPKDLSARSDIKRKIVLSAIHTLPKQQKEHESALRQWIADPSLPDDHLLKPARFLMQIMEEEQAFEAHVWLTQAEIACKALCALSDRAGAVALARKASAYAKTKFFGDDAGWSKVAVAPEKTEWWGLRKKTIN